MLRLLVTGGGCLIAPLEAADPQLSNPVEGLVFWHEGRCEVVDEKRLKDAFEIYLSQPSLPEKIAQARIEKLEETSKILGPGIPGPANLGKAYLLIQQLAGDPIDQGTCAELLGALRRISDVFTRKANTPSNEAALRRQQEILSWNIAVGKKYSDIVSAPSLRKKNKPGGAESNAEEQKLSEVMAEIRKMELGGEVTELQVRLELQDLALRFLIRGDYAESILAVRFYRGLFSDRDGVLRLDPEQNLQISSSGSSPNLGVIENLATLAIANIKDGLASTTSLLQSHALVASSTSLAAAFAQGARTLEVRSYPESAKKEILLQILGEDKLKDLMLSKDYEAAAVALTALEAGSKDFQGKNIRGIIESGKSLSAIHLAAARKAWLEGKDEEMFRELKQATDTWPKNPKISPLVTEFQENTRNQNATIQEFDLLYASHNVLEIARGKDRFEAALASLPARHSEFLGALQEGKALLDGREKAHQLKDFGSPVGAWELAETLRRRYPGQTDLKELSREMCSGLETLVNGLEKASLLEEGQPASALAHYLLLQKVYPQSEFASEGVARLSRRVIEDQGNGHLSSPRDLR
jgi:hypothetical protein